MNGSTMRISYHADASCSADVKEILVKGKRLRAGDSWSKLYAERAFKNQAVTLPADIKKHEAVVKQCGPGSCRAPLTLALAATSTCCRPQGKRTASRMSSMTQRCQPTISRGLSTTRCAATPRALFAQLPPQLDPDNSIIGMLPERIALKGLVRVPAASILRACV